jgi:hypothetical protein
MREIEREREQGKGNERNQEGTGEWGNERNRKGNRLRGRGNREQGNGRGESTEKEGEWERGMELKFNLILVKSGEGSFEGLWVFS